MSRTLKLSLAASGLVLAMGLGYVVGHFRSERFFNAHFLYAMFQRETGEARQELRLLEALREKRVDVALEMTQYSYYSRLLLAADTAQESANTELRQHMLDQLRPELLQAQKMMQQNPFRFPSEEEQRKWVALSESSR